jgi:hypothetical protein
MTNADAARQVVDELTAAGKLTGRDAARTAAFLSLALAVDAAPMNAQLWREYRIAEAALHEVRDDGSDEEAEVTAALSAAVGNATQPGAGNSRN